MTTPTLRPLGVGEILDAGIKLYLRHWKPLMICVGGIVLPVQIVSTLVLALISPHALREGLSASSSSSQVSGSALTATMIVAAVAILSALLASAACLQAVGEAWLGGQPTAARSLRFALRRFGPLIWLAIALVVALTVAFFCLIVPGIWLGVAWSLAVPALLFERVGPLAAIGRSFELVRGRWWPVFGTLLVGYLLALVVASLIQLLPDAIVRAIAGDGTLGLAIAAVIGGTISSLLATPYTAAVVALLYFDQRVRKEGFDQRLLADGLGGMPWQPSAPPAAPPPAAARDEEDDASLWQTPPRRSGDKRADWQPPEAPRGPNGL